MALEGPMTMTMMEICKKVLEQRLVCVNKGPHYSSFCYAYDGSSFFFLCVCLDEYTYFVIDTLLD